jgi:hypothetical protein
MLEVVRRIVAIAQRLIAQRLIAQRLIAQRLIAQRTNAQRTNAQRTNAQRTNAQRPIHPADANGDRDGYRGTVVETRPTRIFVKTNTNAIHN